ncbi:MAG: alpha-L-rhamnosidase [Verrucomicrobia bacterium]|nr:alpha-L-rhamnosidase [Verrucomicrobiota bacterium]
MHLMHKIIHTSGCRTTVQALRFVCDSFRAILCHRLFVLLLLHSGGAQSSWAAGPSQPGLSHLTCEGLVNPMSIDAAAPRFSWRLESSQRGARQAAYQLRIAEVAPDGRPIAAGTIETPRIDSDQSQWVVVPKFVPKPKTRYDWQVEVWDERGRESGWSPVESFETGVRGAWPARTPWIGDGRAVARDRAPAARYFRTEFDVAMKPVKARLYVSAFGLVEPWLNGARIGRDSFLPGWPDYRKRVLYIALDVTPQVQSGRNALGLILGDGWYSGTLMGGRQAGIEPLVSAFLELTDAAGNVRTIATGEDWQWAEGPITAQGIYFGETFDARRDDATWSTPGGAAGWTWRPAVAEGIHAVQMTARVSPPVRRTQELKPVSARRIRPDVFLYDLGQNMVGWVRLKVRAPAGREIQLKFAEMLEGPDQIHTANLRRANATARYIARGSPETETWEPRFTFFGFRYVEVSGMDSPEDDAVTGIVLHSDLTRIGRFECSNPLLNQLYANTVWGQRGNFIEVPTDCPQRDERLGWTGDAQVFCHAASFNYACGNFYRQWLAALRDGYRDEPDGPAGFPDVAPDVALRHGSAGWGDAAVIIPYTAWLHTGDRRLLEENVDAIQQWIEAQARDFPDGIRRSRRSYGDWLAPGFKPDDAPTAYVLIATAYFAHTTDLAARIAAELGRNEMAQRDRALLARIKEAFRREFLSDDGHITSDEQTAYLLALGFDLVPAPLREKVAAHLVRTFAAKNDHLATGFLGTPLVAPVLADIGRADIAYRVLLQESYPGWLLSVKNGATTIWERWDSWTPEKGFNPEGMNSFNHYAYGSVVGWFFDTICGLKPHAGGTGWKKFTVAPTPGGGLTQAQATLETPYGLASSAWRVAADRIEYDITIPANATARIELPATSVDTVTADGRALRHLLGNASAVAADGRVTFTLSAGTYRFSAPLPPLAPPAAGGTW